MVFDDKGTKKHKKNNNFQRKKLETIPFPCFQYFLHFPVIFFPASERGTHCIKYRL